MPFFMRDSRLAYHLLEVMNKATLYTKEFLYAGIVILALAAIVVILKIGAAFGAASERRRNR
jgi:hypothetical protein